MSSAEIWEQIKALTAEERFELLQKLLERYPANVPNSIRQSRAEAERGELINMDDALQAPEQ